MQASELHEDTVIGHCNKQTAVLYNIFENDLKLFFI